VLEEPDGASETLSDIDLLIACDGRYSALREQRCGVPPVTHLGVANFRLLIEDGGSQPIDDLAEWYNGPNRLLAFRVADGRIYLSGNFPIPPGEDIEPAQKTAAGLEAAYLPPGDKVNPLCRFLVEASCDGIDTLHWSRAQEIPTCFTDGSGRFLMLGDSAHAMVPTLGQGATQALEDGSLFLLLYERMRRDGAVDFAAMIRRYEALRRTRIEFARSFSWEASNSLLAGSDPIAATRGKSLPAYRGKLTRLYRELEVAL
jgi:salicylate hydroxylase